MAFRTSDTAATDHGLVSAGWFTHKGKQVPDAANALQSGQQSQEDSVSDKDFDGIDALNPAIEPSSACAAIKPRLMRIARKSPRSR